MSIALIIRRCTNVLCTLVSNMSGKELLAIIYLHTKSPSRGKFLSVGVFVRGFLSGGFCSGANVLFSRFQRRLSACAYVCLCFSAQYLKNCCS